TLSSSVDAIVLNEVTSWASSSRPVGSTRTDKSPPDIRCAAPASRRTGSSTRRDAAYTTPAIAASSTAAALRKKATAVAGAGYLIGGCLLTPGPGTGPGPWV